MEAGGGQTAPAARPVPGQPPPCSWPGPAGAAAPPPHCSVAMPVPHQEGGPSPQLLMRLEGGGETRETQTRERDRKPHSLDRWGLLCPTPPSKSPTLQPLKAKTRTERQRPDTRCSEEKGWGCRVPRGEGRMQAAPPMGGARHQGRTRAKVNLISRWGTPGTSEPCYHQDSPRAWGLSLGPWGMGGPSSRVSQASVSRACGEW